MRTIQLPQIQNVVAGQRATLRFPLGVTYEKLYFSLGTNTIAMLGQIVLKINNKEFQRWNSGLDLMQGLHSYKRGTLTAPTSNMLVMDFTEKAAREEIGMKMGTIAATQEAGVQEFTLELDLLTTWVAGQQIAGWADVGPPSVIPLIQRVQYTQKSVSSATEEQIFVPFGQNGYLVKRLIFKHAQIDSVRVRRDGVDMFEGLPIPIASQRNAEYGKLNVAGFFVLDFMPSDLQSDALVTSFVVNAGGQAQPVQNLDIRVKTKAADTISIYTEAYSTNSQL